MEMLNIRSAVRITKTSLVPVERLVSLQYSSRISIIRWLTVSRIDISKAYFKLISTIAMMRYRDASIDIRYSLSSSVLSLVL